MTLPRPSRRTTALITEATSPWGEAIARELAGRGHAVTLVARPSDRLDDLATELSGRYAVRADILTRDPADPEGRAELADTLATRGREVAVLVNQVGHGPDTVAAMTAAFLPGMLARREGGILNIASSSARSQALAFAGALRREVQPRGVTVTTLCLGGDSSPGPGEFDRHEPSLDSVGASWQVAGGPASTTPVWRWQDVEEAAAAGVRGLDRGSRVVLGGRFPRALRSGLGSGLAGGPPAGLPDPPRWAGSGWWSRAVAPHRFSH